MVWMSQIARLIWRWLLRLAWLIWRMVSLSVASLWVGVRQSQNDMAEDCTNATLDWGIDGRHDTTIKRIARVVVVVVAVLAWIVTAEITVLVLRLIF